MNENKKDMIRPFEIATEKEQFIKPFTIGKEYQGKGNDISKDTEKTNQEDVQEKRHHQGGGPAGVRGHPGL